MTVIEPSSSLQIAREAVRLVGLLLEYGDALAGRVLHALAGVDIAEQKIPAFFPPHRPFDRSERSAHAVRDGVDRLRGGDDLFQCWIELVDALDGLLRPRAADAGRRKAAYGGGHRQHLPARNVEMIGHEVSSDASSSTPHGVPVFRH